MKIFFASCSYLLCIDNRRHEAMPRQEQQQFSGGIFIEFCCLFCLLKFAHICFCFVLFCLGEV
jgi:hypothetical protein